LVRTSSTGERIESYAVVSKDLQGKVKVRDQRRRDAGIGAILGGVIGLVGGPLGVAAGATAGGAAGYLTEMPSASRATAWIR
jgi:uncharacterized membrane protein